MKQDKSRRRISGGKRRPNRKGRKHELGRETLNCKIDEERKKKVDVRGTGEKVRLQATDKVNLMDPETKEANIEEIQDVIESPANPHFARRNFVTKGAIVQTTGGKARVTSRPGQDGTVNAVRVKE